jgi:hypothetical protein
MQERPCQWEEWAREKMKGICRVMHRLCTPKRGDPICRACFEADTDCLTAGLDHRREES